MAESDFLSYSSIYDTFSKGPKSTYYGVGDEMLPGAILNVPQTDEDDEWGRTQRISDERAYDFLAKIYKTLFDPYNSIADISLVPGEAGSEINVAKNMIKLVGRSGVDVGVFDLTIPSMTLGDVVVDGSNNSILIGSGFEATETTLKLNTDLELEGNTDSGSSGSVTYKEVYTSWFDDGSTREFRISVNSKLYVFGTELSTSDPVFELPVGGVLHVQGTSKLNNVLPNGNLSYDIGSTSLKFNNVYSQNINVENLNTAYVYADFVFPTSDGGTLRIGHSSNNDAVSIRTGVFNLYNVSDSIPSLKVDKNTYTIDIGDVPGSYAVNVLASDSDGFKVYTPSDAVNPILQANAYNIWINRTIYPGTGVSIGNGVTKLDTMWASDVRSTNGFFSGLLTTQAIIPDDNNQYDIGSDTYDYKKIYTRHIQSNSGMYSESTSQWYLCGPNLRIKNTDDGGAIVAMFDRYTVDIKVNLLTQDVYPYTTRDYNIGSSSLEYNHIYSAFMHSRYGLYSDATYEWNLCGPNMKIRVNGDSKIGVCAMYIEMYETLYSQSIYPMEATGYYIGGTGRGYEALYLRDQVTGAARRLSVSSGVLSVT